MEVKCEEGLSDVTKTMWCLHLNVFCKDLTFTNGFTQQNVIREDVLLAQLSGSSVYFLISG